MESYPDNHDNRVFECFLSGITFYFALLSVSTFYKKRQLTMCITFFGGRLI